MNGSRILTTHATTSEKGKKTAAPMMTVIAVPIMALACIPGIFLLRGLRHKEAAQGL
jgi:hypothetical protein